MALEESEIKSIINREFEEAEGKEGGTLSEERAKLYRYYEQEPFGNEIEGQSQVVTADVADIVDGIMPSLLRIFTLSDNLLDFAAVGPEDVEGAQQESDYVNYIFFKRNPAFLILYTWFFDAVLQKNGVVKSWWDESEEITKETYNGQSDEAMAALLEDEELELLEHTERTEEVPFEYINPLTGEAMMLDEETTVHDLVFRRTNKGGRIRVDNVPPEHFRISTDARSLDPSKARMVGEERVVTRSELVSMGFPKETVMALPSHTEQYATSPERRARNRSAEEELGQGNDPSQEFVEFRECYIFLDIDEDGIAERSLIQMGGGELLNQEEVDDQPYAVLSPHPLPHKHFGKASAEKGMDIQLITSTLIRQSLDNLYHTNRPGHAVWEQAIGLHTLDDLMTTHVGRVARFTRPVNESWAPITVPFTAKESFPMIDYFQKQKADRTGVRNDSEGLDPETLKNIQSHVLTQASELSRMKIETIARIFAETGIKALFLRIHELTLKYQNKKDVIELRGGFIEVDPTEWRKRVDMTVNIGLGVGTKEQHILHLTDIWQKQMQARELGVKAITDQNLYNTGLEIAKNAEFKRPELFFTDPKTIPEQPDPNQQMVQLQMQLEQARLELQNREMQIENERNKANHQIELMRLEQKELSDERQHQLKQDEVSNNLMIAMERLENEIIALKVKYDEKTVPSGSKPDDGSS